MPESVGIDAYVIKFKEYYAYCLVTHRYFKEQKLLQLKKKFPNTV